VDPSNLRYALLNNPQTFNLYSFVVNDLLKYVDSLGLEVCDCADLGGWDDNGGDGSGCGGGGGGGGDGGGGTDPSSPWPVDACVVATPDPPIDPDPLPDPNPLPPIPYDPPPPTPAPTQITVTISPAAQSWANQQTTPVHGAWTYGNWCGSGGMGQPVNNLDANCLLHDYCYAQNGLSAGMNWGVGLTLSNVGALFACNQALCNGAAANLGSASAQVIAYFSTVPFGYCQ
jgi:hypothetical protein